MKLGAAGPDFHRRHLTTGQRSVAALKLLDWEREAARERQEEGQERGRRVRHGLGSPSDDGKPEDAEETPTPHSSEAVAKAGSLSQGDSGGGLRSRDLPIMSRTLYLPELPRDVVCGPGRCDEPRAARPMQRSDRTCLPWLSTGLSGRGQKVAKEDRSWTHYDSRRVGSALLAGQRPTNLERILPAFAGWVQRHAASSPADCRRGPQRPTG